VLDEAARQELVRAIDAARARPHCEPDQFAPSDPPYTITIGSTTYGGHLPSSASDVEARTQGACAAPRALAWWIVRRFRAPPPRRSRR
jgi:hypothetical protein